MLIPTIVAYDILRYSSKEMITMAVNNAIKQGWQPLGSVIKDKYNEYSQTMVKYEQPKTNSI